MTPLSHASCMAANWITPSADYGEVCPVFRKRFFLPHSGSAVKATLKITALGLYEACLNGNRVGDFVFAPGWTSYDTRLQMQEYDVTSFLREENELLVTLGKGWCAGNLVWEGHKNIWTDHLALIAELQIVEKDGTMLSIITDRDWESAESSIRYSELYHGETYDSNVVPHNWSPVSLYSRDKSCIILQEGETIREMQRLKPVAFIKTPKGETVLDFGQNMTGYVEFSVHGPKGHEVTVRHSEVLDHDGNFYTANLRNAKQKITFICNGERQSYKPHFSFQGFRYICLGHWPEKIDLKRFSAIVVHSDLKRTGRFECSSQLLNQLYSNIIWGQRGNFLDVPTDCPQRDERLGWTGDAEVFIRAASYNYNVNRFFTKWLHDLKADQLEDGGVPAVIPDAMKDGGGASSSAWGDAAVICPWQLYLSYGNTQILKDQFDSMKRWISYIRAQGEEEYLWNTGHHFGDWLGMDAKPGDYVGATDKGLIATAYYAYSTSLFIKAGRVLGIDMSEYEILYQNVVRAFQKTYLSDGLPSSNTQTAHVLVLYFHLCREEDRERIARHLAELIHQNGDRLTTGFVGTPYLLHALSQNGYADLAYTLLLQEEFPSWLFSVKMGATTVWEHWDSLRPDGSMWSTDMNSFNHYAYGAVADWMYGVMAGIQPDEEQPGYEHFFLRPIEDKRLSYVNASLETRWGTISSAWRRENGKIVYEFIVPDGCTASVEIGELRETVRGGKHVYRIG